MIDKLQQEISSHLVREIRKYSILAWMEVRGRGSPYGHHPNRAMWDICGKPSIQWAIEGAKGSKYIDKVAIITESEEIKEIVREIGEVVLIDRPLWTSLDFPRDYIQGAFERKKPRSILSQEAPIYNDNFSYISYYLEQTEGFTTEIPIYFSADSPLVTSQTFDRLIVKFFEDKSAGYAFSACQNSSEGKIMINLKTGRPFHVFPKGEVDRQECPQLFCTVVPTLRGSPGRLETGPTRGKEAFIEISAEEGLDVHSQEDLFLANCYMKRRLLKKGEEVKWEIGQDDKHKKKGDIR